jgi:hypothetical protein
LVLPLSDGGDDVSVVLVGAYRIAGPSV